MDKQNDDLDTAENFAYIPQDLDVSKLNLDCDVSWLEEADAAAGQILLDKIRYLVESGEAAGLKYVDGLIHLALSQLEIEGHDIEPMSHFYFCLNCGVLYHSEYSTNSDPQRDFCKETCEEEWHSDNPGQPYGGELELLKVFRTEVANLFSLDKTDVFVVAANEENALLLLEKEGADQELLESFDLKEVGYDEAVKIRQTEPLPTRRGLIDLVLPERLEEEGFLVETKTINGFLLEVFTSAPAKLWIKKLGGEGMVGYFNHEGVTELKSVISAIKKERAYQDKKHGTIAERPKSLAGWLLIMQHKLGEALLAWNKSHSDKESLRELLQVAAVGWACLEQYAFENIALLVNKCFCTKMPDESYPLMLLKMKHKLESLENLLVGGDSQQEVIQQVIEATSWAIKTIERHGLFERPGEG